VQGYTVSMIYLGACHCEAIGFAYETAVAPEAWLLRACMCRFCRTHGAATTSDRQGVLELVCRDSELLVRYRFGLRTADFWICRGCGVYLGAATIDGSSGIINTNAMVDRSMKLSAPYPMSYEGETVAARSERRRQRWTPLRAMNSGVVTIMSK
jgi:hypothetical protein